MLLLFSLFITSLDDSFILSAIAMTPNGFEPLVITIAVLPFSSNGLSEVLSDVAEGDEARCVQHGHAEAIFLSIALLRQHAGGSAQRHYELTQ
jgi:hypothetical protein